MHVCKKSDATVMPLPLSAKLRLTVSAVSRVYVHALTSIEVARVAAEKKEKAAMRRL